MIIGERNVIIINKFNAINSSVDNPSVLTHTIATKIIINANMLAIKRSMSILLISFSLLLHFSKVSKK